MNNLTGASSSPRVVSVEALDQLDQELCKHAAEYARRAYAPYSRFSVGAAVRTKGGKHFGTNLENASYGLSICAEVAAITAANTAGDLEIETIAVVGHPTNNPAAGEEIVTPCGRCRQIIFEVRQLFDKEIRVICCNGNLTKCTVYLISMLLPNGFGPANLGTDLDAYRRNQIR